MSGLPAVLAVTEAGPGRFRAPHPIEDPEGRDVVFSGQILAQMIMASAAGGAGAQDPGKEVKSIHGVFARTGSYRGGPITYVPEPMHAGRAWASDTVTARQGDRLLARGLLLFNAVEPDLIRHSPLRPEVPGPEESEPEEVTVLFPGAEARRARPVTADGGAPSTYLWVRHPGSYDTVVAAQAALVWSEPGLLIGTAMGAHPEQVDIASAHRSLSTGVISHTAHFHEHAEVAGWLLFVHRASYAGHGRIFGSGEVFSPDGQLVSTFSQDAMARAVDRPLDWRKDM